MYNEQEVVLNFEKEFCRLAQAFVRDLGAVDISINERVGNSLVLPHQYKLRDSYKSGRRTEIFFNNIFYSDSDRVYEAAQISSEDSEEGGMREVITAPTEGLQRKITREEKSREEVTTDYKGSVSFSITHTDKVSAEVKGGVEGVADAKASVESTTQTSLKTDFGWANGQKASKEVTIRGETTLNIPGGQTRILTANISRVKEIQPFTDIAYLDCEVDIDLYNWAGNNSSFVAYRGKHDNIIHSANIQDLLWLMEGKRPVEYPGMKNFLNECSYGSKAFHAWLINKENRKVSLEGQRIKYYPGSLNIVVREG